MKPRRNLPSPARAYLRAGTIKAELQVAADLRFRVLARSPERYGANALEKWVHLTAAIDRARRVIKYRFEAVYRATPQSPSERMETPT